MLVCCACIIGSIALQVSVNDREKRNLDRMYQCNQIGIHTYEKESKKLGEDRYRSLNEMWSDLLLYSLMSWIIG